MTRDGMKSAKHVAAYEMSPRKAHEVMAGFGLTKSQLASILGVSRRALYGWLHATYDLSPASIDKLKQLDVLLRALSSADVSRPDIALNVPTFRTSLSAADLIQAEQWDPESDTRILLVQMAHRQVRPVPDADHDRAMLELERQGRFLERSE